MKSLIIAFFSTWLFHSSDAGTFIWLHSDDTVNLMEHGTAKLNWSVRLSAGKTWFAVKISRNINIGPGGVDMIRRKPSGVQIFLAERGLDMDLDVQENSNVLNVTFTLRNLSRKADEMYYRITVYDDDPDSSVRNTKLNVDVVSTIISHPVNQTRHEGENATITCNVTPPIMVTWEKDGVYFNTSSDARFHVSNDGKQLDITPVQPSDSGSYVCVADNGVRVKSYPGTLTVYTNPSILTHPNSQYIFENFNATLRCIATGNPVPTILWKKDGATVTASNRLIIDTANGQSTLIIIKFSKTTDEGSYTCVATSGSKSDTSNVASLKEKVSLKLTSHPANQTKIEGQNATTTCDVTGTLPIAITWEKDSAYFNTSSDARFHVSNDGKQLDITPVQSSDSGSYMCVAVNGVRVKSYPGTLTVYIPASCIIHQGYIRINEGQVVAFSISTTGNPSVNEYIWIHPNGSRVTANSRLTFTASRNDAGIYNVSVYNGVGDRGYCTSNVTVQYPPSKIAILPSRRQIFLDEGRNSLSLHCQSDSNPPPTYTWMHDGVTLNDGKHGRLVFNNINRRQSGTYRCEAKNRLGSVLSDPIEINVQYLDSIEVVGSNKQSYSQSNPVVLFNLSVTAYPSNTSLSCNPSAPNILTAITSHDAGLNTKQYLVFVYIRSTVDNGSIVCKAKHIAGVRENTLYFYRRPIHNSSNKLVAVLGVLFGFSIVVIIVLIGIIFWQRRKDSKGNSDKRSNNNDEKGKVNEISLQETSFNADNGTPNVPEYEPIGRRGLASSNAGIPQYEAVATRTQASQQDDPIPQYESADRHGQTGAVSNTPPVTYQTIQPRAGNYGSLSPLTRLPPKDASTGSPTGTGEYQALQHKAVSPQYQSLDDLSRC